MQVGKVGIEHQGGAWDKGREPRAADGEPGTNAVSHATGKILVSERPAR